TIDGARGILFNITGGINLSLFEVNEAAALIKESAHPDVNLIFGAQIDETMGDEIRITVIATGFEQSRVARKIDQQANMRPMQSVQRSTSTPTQPQVQRPMPPVQQQQPPAAQPRPQQPAQQQPPRPQQNDFSARVYDEDDMDIPPFLRKRN
ncbi:MAG: cell division protein FtsZ, partial [Chitinophagaceae bacterium]|nr:cell division protein FtsZ [Anaerolineae bacterium]